MKRATIALLLLAANASAATLQWDDNVTSGPGPVVGGDGNWDLVTTNWFDGTNHVAWTNPSDALFNAIPGPTATATLDGADIDFSSITFAVNGYTVATTGAPKFSLSGNATLTTSAGANANIEAQIVSLGGITILGPGTLTLSNGANQLTSDDIIDGGNLVVPIGGTINNGAIGSTYVGNTVSQSTLLLSGTIHDHNGYVGANPSSTNNTATVTGAWDNPGNFFVGQNSSNNTLLVENGGVVQVTSPSSFFQIGGTAGNTQNQVLVTGAGSEILSREYLAVGFRGDHNTFSITNHGTVFTSNLIQPSTAYIGLQNSANFNSATISDPGSLWAHTGDFFVGYNGSNNSLSILNGGELLI